MHATNARSEPLQHVQGARAVTRARQFLMELPAQGPLALTEYSLTSTLVSEAQTSLFVARLASGVAGGAGTAIGPVHM
jgi:hypothetical protein